MISRKLTWLSSLDKKNIDKISSLENRLLDFYFSNPNYYEEINFTTGNWINESELTYIDIFNAARKAENVLEVGCGSANILQYSKELRSKYHGCDFSEYLIKSNSKRFTDANFRSIIKPNYLPYDDSSFDLVFSVFVLEHTTNPALFLNECVRTLKKNGLMIILCPNFLGSGRMTSQRAGFSEGTSNDKLKKKKYYDALVSLFDNRIRIPLYCKYLSYISLQSPKFFINVNPTMFTDKFIPDVDAVYVTYKYEIIKHLKGLKLIANTKELEEYEKRRRIIYLKFIK